MSEKRKIAQEVSELLGMEFAESGPMFFKLTANELYALRKAIREMKTRVRLEEESKWLRAEAWADKPDN